ncbi:DNA primase [Microvirgula aerodenitrificans]|uniref:DNA primase n=1 Tax=Microvirgula aerodenitrificans TaxID=57480 RepID=UPI00248E2FDF|nr:DNA primase [Microvirgula aerodenitrificans]
MIPQDFIDQLLSRTDIVDVVERYVPLKKAGRDYMACCPFHKEKSPSFSVSQTKQFYHCFGCGAHGTAITFMMEHAGYGFVDAVKELAQLAGMQVPQVAAELAAKEAETRRTVNSLSEVMVEAARFYKQQLKSSPVAVEYLKRRGLTGEIAGRFGLGYAPAGWNGLQAVFSDYLDPKLDEAGLLIVRDDGTRYDRFRERVMFPIRDVRGRVIAFGGRILDKGEPKYLNSPETPLFEKGRELYGLFEAREAIREVNRVLVVEGYMDVVALAQHGVSYAVATLGTATTATHVHKLFRHADRVIFCFDGDKAGRRAAWRALENVLPELRDGKRVDFLFLPSEHDPDSYIREYGREGFEAILDAETVPLSAYLTRELSQRVDLGSDEGRAEFLNLAKPLALAVKAQALSILLRKKLAEMAHLDVDELDRLWGLRRGLSGRQGVRSKAIGSRRVEVSLPRWLLRALMLDPALARDTVLPPPAQLAGDAQLLGELVCFIQTTGASDSAGLLERLRDTDLGQRIEPLVAELLVDPAALQAPPAEEFAGAIDQLGARIAGERFDRLKQKDAEQGLSPDEKRELLDLLVRIRPTS